MLRFTLPVATLAFAASFSLSALAVAAPTARARAQARTLAADGRKALKEKRWTDALAKLQSADALDPGPALEVDLAQAQVGAGKLVEASKTLAAVAASTESTLPARKAREAAKRALAAVKARVATVKVRVKGAPSGRATVQVDDEEVDASAEIALNPGYHSVGAAAGGFMGAQREVTLAEGAHAEVTLELTAARPVAVEEEKKTTPGSRAPGAVLTVLGGAGLVAGGIFGGLAFAKTSAARSTCSGDVCPASSADAIATSKTYGNVSTGALIGGGALALTGIILLIVPPRGSASSDDSGKGAAVAPWIGPGVAGLGATGRF